MSSARAYTEGGLPRFRYDLGRLGMPLPNLLDRIALTFGINELSDVATARGGVASVTDAVLELGPHAALLRERLPAPEAHEPLPTEVVVAGHCDAGVQTNLEVAPSVRRTIGTGAIFAA